MALPQKMLQWAWYSLFLIYIIHFAILGFFIGPYDYDHLSAYYELAWRFWSESPGLPHYNPYFCGGRTLGGDPQIPIFNPLTLLVPLIGPTWLIKLELLAQVSLGAYGIKKILQRWHLPPPGQLWGMFAYCAGGALTSRLMVGHVTLGFFILFPLFLHLSYQLQTKNWRPRHALAYLVLFYYCGLYKPNFYIMGVPLLLAEVLARSILQKKIRPLFFFCIAVALSALLNSVTYLPAWAYFSDFPRVDDLPTKFIPLFSFFANLLLPLKTLPSQLYGAVFMQRHEYSVFVGPLTLWFAFWGWKKLNTPDRKSEKWALGILLLFSLWLGLGSQHTTPSAYSLFSWLRPVWPGMESVRAPVRFWFGAYFSIILLSSAGFYFPKRKRNALLLFLAAVLPLWIPAVVNVSKVSMRAHQTQWAPARAQPSDRIWLQGNVHRNYPPIRQGHGVLACVKNVEAFQSPSVQPGPQLPKLATPSYWENWNTIAIPPQPFTKKSIQFNLNHSPYWRFNGHGAKITSRLGQPLNIQPTHPEGWTGQLVFEQPFERMGFLISLGTWCILFSVFLYKLWVRSTEAKKHTVA